MSKQSTHTTSEGQHRTLRTGVYLIRNTVNGKVYVGSAARTFASRWGVHRHCLRLGKHHSRHLQAAWNKYGEAAFEFVILERCPPELCVKREQFWIDHHQATNRKYGYNVSPKAGSQLGFKHKPESIAKCAEASKGVRLNAESRAKLSESLRAYYETPGAREKLTEIRREQCKRPEWLAHNAEKMRKRYESQEERKKQSRRIRKAYKRPEVRRKVGDAVRKALAKPKEKARRGAASSRMWADPEHKKRHSEAIRQAMLKTYRQRPEVRAKAVESAALARQARERRRREGSQQEGEG